MKFFPLIFVLVILGVSKSTYSQGKKFKQKKGMKAISPLSESMDLQIGDRIYYSAGVHGSVGQEVEVFSENEAVLKLEQTHFVYDNKRDAKIPGGDAATKTFVFEASKSGKSVVVIKEIYRGKLEKEHHVKINVISNEIELSEVINSNTDKKEKGLKITKDMVQLVPLNTEQTIEIGQSAYYGIKVHGSVGYQAKVWSENEEILELSGTQFKYENEENAKLPGGDAATETYFFKAIKIGQSTVYIQEIYRGKLKNEYTIKVNVVNRKE